MKPPIKIKGANAGGPFQLGPGLMSLVCIPFVAAVVLATGCKTQSVPYKFSGGNGSTRQQAVIIHARDVGVGTAAELAWLKDHCPQYNASTNKFEASAGHIYSVISVTSTNGEAKLIYFDLTDPIRNSPRQP